jgi:Adenylate and Guanylate cyclase catalytic domain
MHWDFEGCSFNLNDYPSQVSIHEVYTFLPICKYVNISFSLSSKTYADQLQTSAPAFITFAVALVFAITILMFFLYTYMVEKRQKDILDKAIRSTQVVVLLFPKQVADQLIEIAGIKKESSSDKSKLLMANDPERNNMGPSKTPIAELFTHCTIIFGDIVGSTAWSSTRSPEHVFVLLQSIFHRFDCIAKRRRVFKVETIGDCYVAVT